MSEPEALSRVDVPSDFGSPERHLDQSSSDLFDLLSLGAGGQAEFTALPTLRPNGDAKASERVRTCRRR
jgi:hypothetical protein